jgi:hypothetical protein
MSDSNTPRQAEPVEPRQITPITSGFVMATVLPVLWGISFGLFNQLYAGGILQQHLIPLIRVKLGVNQRDIPNYSVLVVGALAYVVSGTISTILKSGSRDGYDNR